LLYLRPPLLNLLLDILRTSLATETEYVREELAAFTNDLISLGVDGLRLDAAKRMSPSVYFNFNILFLICLALSVDIEPDDIANITARLTTTPFITQEVSKRPSVVFALFSFRALYV
jgi:glycosidase